MESKKTYKIIFLIFLLCNLCFMFYWCKQKQGWFLDEGFSYLHSNNIAIHMQPKEDFCIPDDKFFDNFLNVNKAYRFDFAELQQRLIAHPPLFYFIFHTVSLSIPSVPAKWRGLILNLLLFCLTQIVLYAFSRRFLSRKQSFLPLVLYGFSIPAICTVTFIRGYMLFTFEMTLLCLLAIEILRTQGKQKDKNLIRHLVYFFAILFLGCSTHYYFVISAFVLCLGVCTVLLLRKAYKVLAVFSVGSLISVMAVPVAFPVVLSHLFVFERGLSSSVLPMLDKNINHREFNLLVWNDFINKDLFASILPYEFNWSLWVFIALIISGAFCLWRKKLNIEILLLCFVAISSIVLISAVIPLEVKRYFFHLMPLISLLIAIFVSNALQKFKQIGFIISLCIIIFVCGINLKAPNFQHYLYDANTKEGQLSQILQGKTLYVKWSQDIDRWKMMVIALYSPSAKSVTFFDKNESECYQNLIKDKKAIKSTILASVNIDNVGCEEFADWDNFFDDGYTCFYSPKEETNGEINEK